LIHLKILKKSFEIHPRLSHMTAKSAFFQTTKKIWKIYQQKYQKWVWVDFLILFFEKERNDHSYNILFCTKLQKGPKSEKRLQRFIPECLYGFSSEACLNLSLKISKISNKSKKSQEPRPTNVFFLGVFEERRKNRYSIDWLTAFSKVQKNLPHSKNLYSHFLCWKLLKSSFPK